MIQQDLALEEDARQLKMQWWREARFGLFIHWGLYAVAAGEWKGQPFDGVSEWIMKRMAVPVAEYEELAGQFNPIGFDAEAWVGLAKAAGMKYIVITAKHHDGFAMYGSASSPYNIVDATPYGCDPLKALAEACAKEDIRLCFYYSQFQDWHHPDAGGNDWDYPDAAGKDFERYMQEKALPQMRELLTQYGPIGLIWFDTPMSLTEDQSRRFAELVRGLQPNCLINSRVGHQYHDYASTGDNMIPSDVFDTDWEVPATLNHTWGYKKADDNWKSPVQLVKLLVDINRKGGNYLLNVGPRGDGTIPEGSVRILEEVGAWMRVNSEAIYGTVPCPTFPYLMPWCGFTHKPGKLYLHVYEWRGGNRVIFGLGSPVKRAYLLAEPEKEIEFVHNSAGMNLSQQLSRLILTLPQLTPDPIATVIVLEYEGELKTEPLKP
ncbi:alpha-L-fucosidase [Paenibacillus koleovorans]|uniref:alpha-L-fucosidase n=1 Tax=Paenibacillus koleovorans TaxID=121608 RepID=UPI0013E37C11|nr:alpha-L-fucosidase [Paenibacillus koleovorans]